MCDVRGELSGMERRALGVVVGISIIPVMSYLLGAKEYNVAPERPNS